jgi:hypothetical protein
LVVYLRNEANFPSACQLLAEVRLRTIDGYGPPS